MRIVLVLLALGLNAQVDAEATEAPNARELLEDFKTTVDFSYLGDHRWVELKYAEVGRVYGLLDAHPVDTTAVRAGRWSDSSTWSTGSPPGAGSTVWIPSDVRVKIDTVLPIAGPKLVRVDGVLSFETSRNTRLGVGTIVVTHRGHLEIGSSARRVAPDASAEIVFTRGDERDRHIDPMDLTGGLLVTGRLSLFGALKRGVALPRHDLLAGTRQVRFERIPTGWRAGDRLLVPGIDEDRVEDEVVQIATIDPSTDSIAFDRPLVYGHQGPRPGLVPLGNLGRNLVLRSATPNDVSRRGHVMIVHRQGGVRVDSVRFEELGRTRAHAAATRPKVDATGKLVPGSDSNTIGRYMLHFHNRIGARRSELQRVEHSVFEGGPRHGLVNHGGHVLASDNVSFRVAGSHFFGENGTEIGAFRGNLAVRSAGSGDDDLKSRMYTFDFGHGGHGFWLEGGGISLEGNFAFGHRGAAFTVFSRPIEEPAGTPWFDSRNLPSRFADASHWESRLGVDEVPFAATANVAAASQSGFEVWYHKRIPKNTDHEVYSIIDDSVFWGMRKAPLAIAYAHYVKVRRVALFGRDAHDRRGVHTNFETTDVVFEDMDIRGFGVGILIPYFGTTEVTGGRFANERNFVIYTPISWGRRVTISGAQRLEAEGPWRSKYHVALYRPDNRSPRNSRYLYDHNLFFADRIELDGEQVYFFDQAPDAVPLPETGPASLIGLTSEQIRSRFGLTTGGALAGRDAQRRAQIRGLIGKRSTRLARVEPLFEEAGNNALKLNGYRLPDGRQGQIDLPSHPEGWQLVRIEEMAAPEYLLAYVDRTAPRLQLDRRLPQTICPDDLDDGMLIAGRLRDPVGAAMADHKFRQILYDYECVDPETVAYAVDVRDMSGNARSTTVRLRVDPEAPCRGPNIDHYLQVSR